MSRIEEALKRADKLRNSGDGKKNRKIDKPEKLKGLTFIYIIQVICLIIIGALLMGGGVLSRGKIYLLCSVIMVAAAGAYRMLTHYFPRHREMIDKDIEAADVSAEMPAEMISQKSAESETSEEVGAEYEESENSSTGKEAALSSEWVTVDSKGTRSFNTASSNENKQSNERETEASDKWVRKR